MIGRPGINLHDLFHLIILDTSLKLVIRKGEAHTHTGCRRTESFRDIERQRQRQKKDTHTQTDRETEARNSKEKSVYN